MLYSRTAIPLLIASIALTGTAASAKTMPAALTAYAKAWSATDGYHTQIQCFVVKGTQSASNTFGYTFSKPSTISMDVLSGPGAGNNVSWSGGDTVIAGKGLFKKSFALSDPKVTSLRGASLVELSFGWILQHLQKTKGTLTGTTTTLDGAAADVLDLNVADPAADRGMTREALYLSTATNLPVRIDGYVGSQLVSSCTFGQTTAK